MLRLLPILLLGVLLAACVAPQTDGPAPVSPLIPNEVPVLLENQWRLTEIIYNGTSYDFDAIAPVLVTFQPGRMQLDACDSSWIFFDTENIEDPNEYRLRTGSTPARDCPGGGGGTEQESNLKQALFATNRYEIDGDVLILSGENVQVTFVIDNEATKPNEAPVLLENQWRLTEIIYNGTSYDFDTIAPVLVTFQPGRMQLDACDISWIFFDATNIEDPNEYRLRTGSTPARDCPDGGTEQESNLEQALFATKWYKIEGNMLILSGENARVTFVIDNEATKPPQQ